MKTIFAFSVFLLYWLSVNHVVPVNAQRSFECQKVWKGPTTSNDINTCLLNSSRIFSEWRYYILPFFLTLLLISCVTWLVVVFCCSLSPSRRKDVTKINPLRRKIRQNCILAFGFLLLGVLVMFLLIFGAAFLFSIPSKLISMGENEVLPLVEGAYENVTYYLSDHTTKPPQPPSVDISGFDDATKYVEDTIKDFKSYRTLIYIFGIPLVIILGILIPVLVFPVVLVARFNKCTHCALSCGWLYYLLAIFFALLALVCSLLFYGTSAICGEVTLQFERKPGIFQWMILPHAQSLFNLAPTAKEVQQLVLDRSVAVCKDLEGACDRESSDTNPFICPSGFEGSTSCTSVMKTEQFLSNTVMKPDLIEDQCPPPRDQNLPTWECNVEQCATYCIEDATKTLSRVMMEKFYLLQNMSTAESWILPFSSPNYIPDFFAGLLISNSSVDSGVYYHKERELCSNLRLSVLAWTLMFIFGVFLLLGVLCVMVKAAEEYKNLQRIRERMDKIANESEESLLRWYFEDKNGTEEYIGYRTTEDTKPVIIPKLRKVEARDPAPAEPAPAKEKVNPLSSSYYYYYAEPVPKPIDQGSEKADSRVPEDEVVEESEIVSYRTQTTRAQSQATGERSQTFGTQSQATGNQSQPARPPSQVTVERSQTLRNQSQVTGNQSQPARPPSQVTVERSQTLRDQPEEATKPVAFSSNESVKPMEVEEEVIPPAYEPDQPSRPETFQMVSPTRLGSNKSNNNRLGDVEDWSRRRDDSHQENNSMRTLSRGKDPRLSEWSRPLDYDEEDLPDKDLNEEEMLNRAGLSSSRNNRSDSQKKNVYVLLEKED